MPFTQTFLAVQNGKDDPKPCLIIEIMNVITVRNIAILFYETFCYLDTISLKVCFIAIVL